MIFQPLPDSPSAKLVFPKDPYAERGMLSPSVLAILGRVRIKIWDNGVEISCFEVNGATGVELLAHRWSRFPK